MPEDQGNDDVLRRLSDPLLDEIQFNGVSVGETWRVQTDIEEFLRNYSRRVGIDDVSPKYTIGDQPGTRNLSLHLSDRCLFSPEVVVGIQTEVLASWPQWTVALVGYSREGEIATISSRSVSAGSENVDDIALFMQKFADEELAECERRFGPLERQKQYVEVQLTQSWTITEDQPFQILAICEHWSKPHEYLGVWVIGDSDIDEVAIFVPGEEPISEGTQYAVSPTGKLLDEFESEPDESHVGNPEYWVNQWLIPRDYQGRHLIAQRDSDSRRWKIPFDKSSMRTNSELQKAGG